MLNSPIHTLTAGAASCDFTHNVGSFAVVFVVPQSCGPSVVGFPHVVFAFVIEIIDHFSFTAGLQKTHVVRRTRNH